MTDTTPLHRITEPDLAELERVLPQLLEFADPHWQAKQRTQWRRVIQIISDVRWNYGPHTDVEVIDAGDEQ